MLSPAGRRVNQEPRWICTRGKQCAGVRSGHAWFARGGMGRILSARDRWLGRTVASA